MYVDMVDRVGMSHSTYGISIVLHVAYGIGICTLVLMDRLVVGTGYVEQELTS